MYNKLPLISLRRELIEFAISVLGVLLAILFYLYPKENFTGFFSKRNLEDFVKSKSFRKQYKVAIIDDELESFPVECIRRMGFDVQCYESISFADATSISKFDVVFLDVKGVVEDDLDEGGAKLINILKAERENLPVVAVSSGKFQPELNDYFKKSDFTINKPVTEYKVSEILKDLKSDFLNISSLISNLKGGIRKLDIDKKGKNKIEVEITKLLEGKASRDNVVSTIHKIATVDAANLIKQVDIIEERVLYD